jgi:Mg2+/Co2+ transporter CorB
METLLLVLLLGFILLCSALFAGSETGIMTINRYRLRYLAGKGHKNAQRALRLLERPDSLIGVILLGNSFLNTAASSIGTAIAIALFGPESGIAIAAVTMTLLIFVFAELLPKTIAAYYPEQVGLPSAFLLTGLLRLCYPFVWAVNAFVNAILSTLGLTARSNAALALSREELRSVVLEAGEMISQKHQQMLFGILDLEKVTVEDIMVPRAEIVGLDLDDPLTEIRAQILACRHTRLPVYRGNLGDVAGILHARKAARLLSGPEELSVAAIEATLTQPYYVPIRIPLHTQLMEFQREHQRLALVVDEYGDVRGLVTLEALLEEIVGEFTTHQALTKEVFPQEDGSFLVDAQASLRDLNRTLGWHLPEDGPKTLNGLLLETLEEIPEPGTTVRIGPYTMEIVHASDEAVKTAKVSLAPGATGASGAGAAGQSVSASAHRRHPSH